MSTSIIPLHAQTVALYEILKISYVVNTVCDVKLQVTMAAKFNVSEVLSMCYNSVFGLSEDESSYDEGEKA